MGGGGGCMESLREGVDCYIIFKKYAAAFIISLV